MVNKKINLKETALQLTTLVSLLGFGSAFTLYILNPNIGIVYFACVCGITFITSLTFLK